MTDDPAVLYVAASCTDGVGPRTIARLRDRHGTIAAVAEAIASPAGHVAVSAVEATLRTAFRPASLRAAAATVRRWRASCDALLHPEHPDYPGLLATTHDPPPLLFVRGRLPAALGPAPDRPAVAVVGTRRASPWALSFAQRLGRELASAGVTVVSGLALGVDGAAHRGALDADPAGTVAVLGAGFDHLHPPAHRALARRIATGGALLTEHPPDVRARPGSFPRRNRVISGLSRAVVVVEAPAASGVRHTIDFALDQGREVYVVPQRPDSEAGRAATALLREGATPLGSAADLLSDVGLASRESASADSAPSGDVREAAADGRRTSEAGSAQERTVAASDLAKRIMSVLDGLESASLERLIQPSSSPSATLAALTELELAGRARPDGNGGWRAV